MAQQTPLYDQHLAAGAQIVDFAGWQMPIHYGSQLDEHRTVRTQAGVFDVSHMAIVDIHGPAAHDFLRHLLANDIAKLKTPGKALYSCMLNPDGGIIDDLIVYFLAPDRYRVVLNAARRDADLAWAKQQAAAFDVSLDERTELCMLALQGPHAWEHFRACVPTAVSSASPGLKPFFAVEIEAWCVARTGYTGEDGCEIMLPAPAAKTLWDSLIANGVRPIGLGARDTLRLEAGMSLYGNDMDESTTPWESGLGWTVSLRDSERRFVGRSALETQQQNGVSRQLVGLVLSGRGVLRAGQRVVTATGAEGVTTSGTFSPTLQMGIALARVPAATTDACQVDIRGKLLPARVVTPPFVRHGTSQIDN